MSTALLPAPQLIEPGTSDEQHHVFCCDPDVSLCGMDISDETECPESCGERMCEFCERVYDLPCLDPKCWQRPRRFWQVWR